MNLIKKIKKKNLSEEEKASIKTIIDNIDSKCITERMYYNRYKELINKEDKPKHSMKLNPIVFRGLIAENYLKGFNDGKVVSYYLSILNNSK